MKKISLLSIVLSVLFLNEVEGQRYSRKKIDVFQASIIGGFHLSQMDGDSYTGYDKINPQFGLKSSVYLSSTLFLDVGLSYTSKGAQFESEAINFRASRPKDRSVHLNYVEVPFTLRWNTSPESSRFYIEGGFSYNRMVSSDIEEEVGEFTTIVFENFESDFRNWEISSILGAGYRIGKRSTIGVRFNYGLTKFFINENPREENFFTQGLPAEVLFLRNYTLGIQVSYQLL